MIITISRQVGSYGDVVAAIAARKLGLELVGRDKVHELAQQCDPDYSQASRIYEAEHGPGLWERIFFDRPSYMSLFEALTYQLAAAGNVVLVGRGAQIILRNIPGVLKVRVTAPLSVRIARVRERYGMSASEAEEFVRKYDHQRDSLIRSVFLADPDDWSLYDLALNTAHFSSAVAAELTVHARAGLEPAPEEATLKEQLSELAFAKFVETAVRKRMTSTAVCKVRFVCRGTGKIQLLGSVRSKGDLDELEKLVTEFTGVHLVQNNVNISESYVGEIFGKPRVHQ